MKLALLAFIFIVSFGCVIIAADLNLIWDASPDASDYRVYYGASSGGYTNFIDASDALSCTVTGLVDGVTYYFAATAFDSNGVESDFSNEFVYTVPASGGAATNAIQFERRFLPILIR